jgi:hypothetical protein
MEESNVESHRSKYDGWGAGFSVAPRGFDIVPVAAL